MYIDYGFLGVMAWIFVRVVPQRPCLKAWSAGWYFWKGWKLWEVGVLWGFPCHGGGSPEGDCGTSVASLHFYFRYRH